MYHVASKAPRDGLNDAVPGITSLLIEIGTGRGTLHFEDGVYLIGSDLYLQPNISLSFDGACLSVADGVMFHYRGKQAVDVSWFGANGTSASAVGDIVAGSNLLYCLGGFLYVGNPICVHGAGADGSDHYARILANNGVMLTLDKPAITAVTGASIRPADCTAFNQMLAAHPGPDWFYSCQYGVGTYQTHKTIRVPEYTTIRGAGRNIARLTQHGQEPVLQIAGGVNLRDVFLHAAQTGECLTTNAAVINDCYIDACWFLGSGKGTGTGAAITGNITNSVINAPIFEDMGTALAVDASKRLTIENAIYHNVTNIGNFFWRRRHQLTGA